jgi:hypothetical protein
MRGLKIDNLAGLQVAAQIWIILRQICHRRVLFAPDRVEGFAFANDVLTDFQIIDHLCCLRRNDGILGRRVRVRNRGIHRCLPLGV